MNLDTRKILWDANIPGKYMLQKTIKLLVISFSIVWVIVEAISQFDGKSFTMAIVKDISKGNSDVFFASALIGIWLIISFFFCWALFPRGYEASFKIDSKGAYMATRSTQRKKNKMVNAALFVLSLLSRRPGGMGTAILAESRQSVFYKWKDIDVVRPYPDSLAIDLESGWRTLLRFQCTPDNYAQVLSLTTEYYQRHKAIKLVLR